MNDNLSLMLSHFPKYKEEVESHFMTDNDFMTHSFKVKTLGDIFLNPVGCTPTRTNDLSFICGEVPAA